MLQNIPLGLYYPGNSVLHSLQARTKLLMMLWLLVFLAVASQRKWHFLPYLTIILLIVVAIAVSGVSVRDLWQRMWLLVLLVLLGAFPTVLLADADDKHPLYTVGPFLTPYTVVTWAIVIASILLAMYLLLLLLPMPRLRNLRQNRWFRRSLIILLFPTISILMLVSLVPILPKANALTIGPIVISHDGIWLLVSSFTIFLVLYAFSLLLTMTTPPVALIEGLSLLLTPLRRLRLPIDEFALMALLALRFFPTLIEEVEQLLKAQTARGADISEGTLRERLQSLVALFVPLMQRSLRRATDLSVALEARGYEVEGSQTLLYETSLGTVDYITLGVVVLVTLTALYLG